MYIDPKDLLEITSYADPVSSTYAIRCSPRTSAPTVSSTTWWQCLHSILDHLLEEPTAQGVGIPERLEVDDAHQANFNVFAFNCASSFHTLTHHQDFVHHERCSLMVRQSFTECSKSCCISLRRSNAPRSDLAFFGFSSLMLVGLRLQQQLAMSHRKSLQSLQLARPYRVHLLCHILQNRTKLEPIRRQAAPLDARLYTARI